MLPAMDAQSLIKELRGEFEMTQAQIAARTGIAQSTVCAYELGRRGIKRGAPYEVVVKLKALRDEKAAEAELERAA